VRRQRLRCEGVSTRIGWGAHYHTWVVGLRPVQELANAPAVAIKDFLASPVKGVPIVSGAVQGITDAFETDLTPEQRAKRIAIAAGTAVAIAGLVALVAPEGAAAVALGLVLNAGADLAVKPLVFQTWDLNPHREEPQAGEG